jgi:hypothetical protein
MLILLLPLCSFSQADTSVAADTASKHSLYAGAGYGSNMIYLGSTISGSQPFGYGSITYGFNDEFSASVSAFHLAGNKPFMAFYSGSLNYNHVFISWFDCSAGVSGYIISPELADIFFDDFLYGDATLGIDWKLIYTQNSAGLLIYNGKKGYFQMKNSRYFQTPKLFNSKLFIAFDPYINLLFGNIITAETAAGNTMTIPFNGRGKGRPGQPVTV